jgi:hypothetical protein
VSDSKSASSGGIGVMDALGVLFVGLKLAAVIDWSWWWVTAPFWGPWAFVLAFIACAVGFGIVRDVMRGGS